MKTIPPLLLSACVATTSLMATEQESALSYHAVYTAEGFYNLSGGIETGGNYLGLVDIGFEYDLSRHVKVPDLAVFANVFFLHGSSVSAERIGDTFAVSNLDSDVDNARLFEAGISGSFAEGNGTWKIGQLAADSDFFGSDNAGLFLNSTFGWAPAVVQAPAPAYAQASLGALVSYAWNDSWGAMVGIYSTDIEDPETKSSARHGYDWNFSGDHSVALVEVSHQRERSSLKVGFWYNTDDYDDFDGTSTHDDNWGLYAVLDHVLYQKEDSDKNVNFFLRSGYSPEDRNVFTTYLDTGFVWAGWIPNRPDDTFGIAYGIGILSSDYNAISDSNDEGVLELTYQAVISENISLQPTLQYVMNPGGPDEGTSSDAWAAGLRCVIAW